MNTLDGNSGFYIQYASHQDLAEDLPSYVGSSNTIVPWKDPPPPLKTNVVVRIEAPDGTRFDLGGRVGRHIDRLGFVVTFDDSSKARLSELAAFVHSPTFVAALKTESTALRQCPQVGTFCVEPKEDSTEPDALLPAKEPAGRKGTRPEECKGTGLDEREGTGPEEIESTIQRPGPGDEYIVYVVKYATVKDYLVDRANFRESGTFTVPYENEHAQEGALAQLRLQLPGHNLFKIFARVETVTTAHVVVQVDENDPAFKEACDYADTVAAKNRLKNEKESDRGPPSAIRMMEGRPADDSDKLSIRGRLQRMGMDEKINLALSGTREERMALAMDSNKAVHHYLLKNAKITQDEIAFMCRLPSLNPDVLDRVAENPVFTQSSSILKALVYNPKTPIPTAIRLLDRLPRPEILNLAKSKTRNQRLVMAAKKKIEGKAK